MSPQPNPLLQQLLPAITIPDGTFGSLEADKKVRLVYETMATAFQRLQNLVNTDPRMSDTRIAHGLYTQQGDVMFDYATLPRPGEVPFAVDGGRRAVWNAATSGGVTPVVTPHNLFSATHPDTVAASPVLGDVIFGNSTPAWTKLAGNTTTTRKFLRQTGTGAISAAPVWDTLVAGDIPALATAGGWTDDGTVVRLTTSTDQVGIGTTTPGASLGIVNVNNVADILLKITTKASQTGAVLQALDSAGRSILKIDKDGSFFMTDDGAGGPPNCNIYMGAAKATSTGGVGSLHAIVTWGDNASALSAPTCTADMQGCKGARFYTYKDPSGLFDCAYGQDAADAWVLVSDESITYSIFTGLLPVGTASFLRAQWAGNGDFTNYGLVHVRKNLGAATKGVPGLRLEETGAGTDYLTIRAPAAVTGTTRIQTLQNLTGVIPLVGDDPPAVASGALGKVDSTGQTAAIGSTNLSNTPPAGLYAVEVYAACTTASGSGAPTLDVTIGWTDVVGATTANAAGLNGTTFPLALSATGRAQARFIIQVASGNITYATTINAASGSPQYALYIRVVSLG